MSAYYDTGVLLPLYVEEMFTEKVSSLVERRNEAIAYNKLHEIEFENAANLKVFRREFAVEKLACILRHRDADIQAGRLVLRSIDWPQALERALRLIPKTTAEHGCRTLDVLHVAIAVAWDCTEFISADDRQLKAAAVAGLKPLDVKS